MNEMVPGTQKILIVDDDSRMCESLRLLLNSHDLEVFTAVSGHQALDLLSINDFDLAIIDIILPDMNGNQLMEHIHVGAPDTVVIIITGHASLNAAVKALQKGAYDYLRKPFEFDRLLNTVKNALKQKRLKCENIAANRKLAQSEERYRFLVQNSPDVIYTLDEHAQFTFISEAVERLLGFQIVELIGRHFTTVVYEDDRDKANQLLEEWRAGYRNPSSIELRFNVRGNQQKSKFCEVKHIPYEGKTTDRIHQPAMEKGKRNFCIYGVARDINNRKRLEMELLQAQKMEAIGTLAGGIAHDFNNLLMGIQGHVCLMLLNFDSQHRYYRSLKTIEQCVQNGAELTRQILDFSKARGGKPEVVSADLNEIIENSLSMFGRIQKEVRIRSVLQEGIWAVGVDRIKIQQVMINIFINAWQAMPEGGTLIIETKNVERDQNHAMASGVEPGKYVKVSVTDTGIGMDKATQKRIFEPYFTTKTRDRGSGLGLATVYGIIKDHCGTIEVHSEKGKGTSFVIFLPA